MYDKKIKFIQEICMPRKRIQIKCLQIQKYKYKLCSNNM